MVRTELNLLEYYKQIREHNILLSFKGALSQEILVDMGSILKEQISVSKKIKKIFSVFVELAQNIMHYSKEREMIGSKDIGVGILVFTEKGNKYHVISGNLIELDQVKELKSRLETVNSLSDEALKKYFKQESQKPRGDRKGAGLGFIEIARKSKNTIDFNIEQIDETSAFLIISVTIDKD